MFAVFKQRGINKEGNVIFSTFITFLGKTIRYTFQRQAELDFEFVPCASETGKVLT